MRPINKFYAKNIQEMPDVTASYGKPCDFIAFFYT